MKKFTLFLLSFLFALRIAAAEAEKSLVVTFDNGTTQTFLLSSCPEVSVADDMLVVAAGGTTVKFTLGDVLTFTFAEASGIVSVQNTPDIMRRGDVIIVSAPVDVEAYTTDGKSVSVRYSKSGSTTAVSLTSLPKGITVLRMAGKTLKICR